MIPSEATLKNAYRMFVEGKDLRKLFEAMRKEREGAEYEVPENLIEKIHEVLEVHDEYSWHEAVQSIADKEHFNTTHPEEPANGDGRENDEDDEDEDFSDLDE